MIVIEDGGSEPGLPLEYSGQAVKHFDDCKSFLLALKEPSNACSGTRYLKISFNKRQRGEEPRMTRGSYCHFEYHMD